MCLDIFNNQVNVAKQDILCYKFLRLRYYGESLVSPYQEFEYEMGKEYISNLHVRALVSDYEYSSRVVEEGFHTISSEEETRILANAKNRDARGMFKFALVKCIIPKGASYYEGTWRDIAGYASSRIKIVEILPLGNQDVP